MTIAEMQQEIIRLKKEKDVCILAHSYQAREILEVADFTGDSYKLSVDAKGVENKNIIMCGVRFMAETVKLLSPEKKVYLANPTAGCPMAEQMDRESMRTAAICRSLLTEHQIPPDRLHSGLFLVSKETEEHTANRILLRISLDMTPVFEAVKNL